MGHAVGPVGHQPIKGTPPPGQNQTKTNIESAMEAMSEALQNFDTEAQGASKDQLRGTKTSLEGGKTTAAQSKSATYIPHIEDQAASAGLINEDDIKTKKKKKKSKWKEKLEKLAGLEGQIDDTQLQTEEKGIIKEFFSNMNQIKDLKAKLSRLEHQEQKYQELLEKQNENPTGKSKRK